MQKDIGISTLIFAIIAIFTPFGAWLTIFVALMVTFAYGEGLLLGIASIIVNMVHIVFFSSRLWSGEGLGEFSAAGESPFLPWILIAAQVIAIVILFLRHKKFKAMTGTV
jgi:hypothetical protein